MTLVAWIPAAAGRLGLRQAVGSGHQDTLHLPASHSALSQGILPPRQRRKSVKRRWEGGCLQWSQEVFRGPSALGHWPRTPTAKLPTPSPGERGGDRVFCVSTRRGSPSPRSYIPGAVPRSPEPPDPWRSPVSASAMPPQRAQDPGGGVSN